MRERECARVRARVRVGARVYKSWRSANATPDRGRQGAGTCAGACFELFIAVMDSHCLWASSHTLSVRILGVVHVGSTRGNPTSLPSQCALDVGVGIQY